MFQSILNLIIGNYLLECQVIENDEGIKIRLLAQAAATQQTSLLSHSIKELSTCLKIVYLIE